MRNLLRALLLLCLTATGALAQTGTPQNKSALQTEISTNFPDNTSGLITPAITRTSLSDFLASWQNQRRYNAQVGTSYTFVNDDNGKLVAFTNGSAIAVTLPQATTAGFVAWESVACNRGAGAVTITPTVSTINGQATLVLGTDVCVAIVSNGANYFIERLSFQPHVNAQTGTSYTVAYSDLGNFLTFNNGATVTVTIPNATGLFTVFSFSACNKGSGTVNLTPTTATINGSATFPLSNKVCTVVVSDGTNYQATTVSPSAAGTPTSSFVAAGSHSGGFSANSSGTYTTPANVTWIEITLIGGGSGGSAGGSGGSNSGAGGNTCWNTSGAACTSPVYQAGGGGAANSTTNTGGARGTVSGSGTCTRSGAGQSGSAGTGVAADAGFLGGNSIVGGAGANVQNQGGTGTGEAAVTASGSGGQGGGSNGAGGGSGAYCYVIITAPAATYTYAVGASGAGGTGGTGSNGGAGGDGQIFVVEHYGS